MNKARRASLNALIGQIEDIRSQVEALRDEEQEYYDNMPESLQGADKGSTVQAAIDAMEEAVTGLEQAEQQIASAAE